jgi:hypothetical protein
MMHEGQEGGESEEGGNDGLEGVPLASSVLQEAYMQGLLDDTGTFAAHRREVIALGRTFEHVAARLEVRGPRGSGENASRQ